MTTTPPGGEADQRGTSERTPDDIVSELLASLPATSERAQLNEAFAQWIPSSEPALEAAVRRGVWKSVWVDFSPSMKQEYGTLSAAKASRLYQQWRKDPQAFERQRPAAMVEALREFACDAGRDGERWRTAWLAALDAQLPTPTAGYQWVRDPGGLWSGQYTFRLWRRDFGIMPISE